MHETPRRGPAGASEQAVRLGRDRAPSLLGTLAVGPKTGVDLMLVENSFADVLILGEKPAERRDRTNGEAGPHLDRFFPLLHILLDLVIHAQAIFDGFAGAVSRMKTLVQGARGA